MRRPRWSYLGTVHVYKAERAGLDGGQRSWVGERADERSHSKQCLCRGWDSSQARQMTPQDMQAGAAQQWQTARRLLTSPCVGRWRSQLAVVRLRCVEPGVF